MQRAPLTTGLGLAIALALANPAQPAAYHFTPIAHSGDGQILEVGDAAINAAGQIAFVVRIPKDDTETGAIYRLDGGTLVPIFEGDAGWVALDDVGTVFFTANDSASGGVQIRAGDGGETPPLYSTEEPFAGVAFLSFLGLVARGDGILAFLAGVDRVGDEGIFVHREGTLETVVSGAFDLSYPALGANGQVAFWATEPSEITAVYRSRPDALPQLIADDQPFLNPQAVGLDDAGNVTFARHPSILRTSGGPPSTLVDNTGAFAGFDDVRVNPRGDLLFSAWLDTGSYNDRAIYRGPDPVADRVIGIGDALLGSTIDWFWIAAGAFNDAGQILFRVSLADGTSALVRADPVPEPGAALATAAAFGALAFARRR